MNITTERLNRISNKYYWYEIPIKNKTNTIRILVKALSAASAFGRIDVFIEPVFGTGAFWVRYTKLTYEPFPLPIIENSFLKFKNFYLQENIENVS